MKRILSIALILTLCVLTLQARRYYDSILQGIPQHVKSIVQTTRNSDGSIEETTFLYTPDGQEVYSLETPVLVHNYIYDSNGYPQAEETSYSNEPCKFTYDSSGHIISTESNTDNSRYVYSGNNPIAKKQTVFSLLGPITIKEEYKIKATDSHGNWTEREVSLLGNLAQPTVYTESRRIEYYPESSAPQSVRQGDPRFTLLIGEISPSSLVKNLLGTFPWGKYSMEYFNDYFKKEGFTFKILDYGSGYELYNNFYGCGPIKGGKQILPTMRIGLGKDQFVLSVHNLKKGEFKKIRNDIINELTAAGSTPTKGKNDIEGEFWYGQINGIRYRINSLHIGDHALFFRVYQPCFGTESR